MQTSSGQASGPAGRQVRGLNRDFGAGLFLLAIGLIGFFGSYTLKFTQASGVGAGLMPRVTALLVGAFGVLLIVQAFVSLGDRLQSWSLRGIVFLIGAVLAFAILIRGFSLALFGTTIVCPAMGLAVAGPVAVVTAALADRETRWRDHPLRADPDAVLRRALQIHAAPADPARAVLARLLRRTQCSISSTSWRSAFAPAGRSSGSPTR